MLCAVSVYREAISQTGVLADRGAEHLVGLALPPRPPLDRDPVARGDEHAVVGRLRVGGAGPDHDAGLHPRAARVGLGDDPGADRAVAVGGVGRVLREALRDEPEVVEVRPDVGAARLDGPGAGGAAALLRGEVDLVAGQDVGADVGAGEARRADARRLGARGGQRHVVVDHRRGHPRRVGRRRHARQVAGPMLIA